MPRLYIVDAEQPNAFATGRDPRHAAIAVTTGLIARLEDAEIAGVIAHELSHVIRRDTLTMTLAATLAGAVGMLAPSGRRRGEPRSVAGAVGAALAKGIAPLAAMVVRMAISHAREYEADRSGALLAGRPLSLADALEKLDGAARGSFVPEADRHPATAHLFIVNPLRGASLADLFGTHPPIAERVRRLKAMTGAAPSRFGPWDAEPWERA
jgi:heat shock protein HtpX